MSADVSWNATFEDGFENDTYLPEDDTYLAENDTYLPEEVTLSTTKVTIEEASLIAMRQYYSKLLMGLARDPKTAAGFMGLNASLLGAFFSPHDAALANLSVHLTSLVKRRHDPGRTVIIILVYSILIVVSLFGNLLVCHVVLRTRRLHTLTNTFLANLAVSDLLMTALNIPFNVARVLLDDWPFGGFMCSVVPFVQVTSVCVSAFTMVAIALDRYQVIVHPLKPRLGTFHGAIIIVVIWLLAALVSLPYAIYSEVVEVFTYKKLTRCQAHYPPPALQFRQWLTLATFLTQYVVPLSITAVAYVGVTRRVWWRAVVGAATQEQLSLQLRAKKKTVKMLLIVVVLFALCWLPLNTYHLVVDFGASVGPSRHSSSIFFICHWFAMSNVCYNPFIYCWLNDHFRAGAKAWLMCAARKICRIPNMEVDEEPPGVRTSHPRDSVTLSSSTLFGGSSIRRKMGSGSVRSNPASDFHVTLDELMITPSSSQGIQQKYRSNSFKRDSKKRRSMKLSKPIQDCPGKVENTPVYSETASDIPGIQNTVSIVSCTHGNCGVSVSEMPRVEVDPPCILDVEKFDSTNQATLPFITVEDIAPSDKIIHCAESAEQKTPQKRYIDQKNKKDMRSISVETEPLQRVLPRSIDDYINQTDLEFISINPKLCSIPEESSKTLKPQVMPRCADCQKTIQQSIFFPNYISSSTIDGVTLPENNISNITKSNEVAENVLFKHPTSVDGDTIRQNKESKSPKNIINAIRASIAASLAKRLSAIYNREASSSYSPKSSLEIPGRHSSPSLCWLEVETSTNILDLKYVASSTNKIKSDIPAVTKGTENTTQRQDQTRLERIDIVLPNVVMESNNFIQSDTNLIIPEPWHQIFKNSSIRNGQDSASVRINNYSSAQHAGELHIKCGNSETESKRPATFCGSEVIGSDSVHEQNFSSAKNSLHSRLRAFSTPNLTLLRSGTIVPQKFLQPSCSMTSWSTAKSSSPSRRQISKSVSPATHKQERIQVYEDNFNNI